MWSFVKRANGRVEDVTDDINAAESTFNEVLRYYGEDDKNMTSSEFFGIFKTFVTSYRKCKSDNQTAAEERLAVEKRKQAAEEMRANREKALEAAGNNENNDVLDSLLEKLRSGDTAPRKSRRAKGAAGTRHAVP
ncbi:hypothetical protein MPER_13864, partial [Moniliophthora perniciosa FA553]